MTPEQERLVDICWEQWSALSRIIRFLLGSEDGVDDVLQDVVVEILKTTHMPSDPIAWLRQVARHKAISEVRRQIRRRNVSFVDPTELDATCGDESDWLSIACNEESARALEKEIGLLPDLLRAAVVLKYHENLSHAEVAGLLGINAAASRRIVYQALRRLRSGVARRVGGQ